MEKKRRVISFRITSSQYKQLEAMLKETGKNKNEFFQEVVNSILSNRLANVDRGNDKPYTNANQGGINEAI